MKIFTQNLFSRKSILVFGATLKQMKAPRLSFQRQIKKIKNSYIYYVVCKSK